MHYDRRISGFIFTNAAWWKIHATGRVLSVSGSVSAPHAESVLPGPQKQLVDFVGRAAREVLCEAGCGSCR